MGHRQTKMNHNYVYPELSQWLHRDAVIPGSETYHNYSEQKLIQFSNVLASGGAGATLEMETLSGETVADIAKTEATLIMASDTNDNAYDSQTCHVYYKSADGVQHGATATFNAADSRTEVAFNDDATGLVPVTDFYCFDTEHYGTLAVVSTVAVQAGDNVCIGVTGAVAGIADPDICFGIILAAATSPTLANMFGVGCVYCRTKTNQADAGYIDTIEYVTPWGELKTATYTIPADGTVETRLYDETLTTIPVVDFYRRREFSADHAALDEHLICNDDDTVVYGVIEVGKSQSVHSRHMVLASEFAAYSFLMGLHIEYATLAEFCTITLTYTPYGLGEQTMAITIQGGVPWDIPNNIQLEPCTEVKVEIADDAAAGGNFLCMMDILETEA